MGPLGVFLILYFILKDGGGGTTPAAPPAQPPPPAFPPPQPATPPATPPPGTPPAPPPGTPPAQQTTYTIKAGDNPSALAKKATGNGGRWKEIPDANPSLNIVNTRDAEGKIVATHVVPFNPGQVINWPPGWPPLA